MSYKKYFVPFHTLAIQHKNIGNEIDKAIKSVISSGSFIRGKYVKLFEKKFSKMYDNRTCISCANGTDAIYIALKSLNIKKGDEVIVPSISWISSSETVTQSGAKVKFVDVDSNCLIDCDKLEKAITKKTKALVVVHLYGKVCNMSRIMKFAKKNNLFVIEDCAQSHFAEWKNKKVGTFGDFGTFSFYPGKNIGALGDAGCVIVKNKSLAKKFRMIASHGSSSSNKHEHDCEGVNSRMDGIQAAILSVKLKYIKKWNKRRVYIANQYCKFLKDNKNILLPIKDKNEKCVFHLFVIQVNNREHLIKKFKQHNIGYGIHYPKALPNLKAYRYLKVNNKNTKMATYLQKKILSLPMYPELENWQIKKVCNIINKYSK